MLFLCEPRGEINDAVVMEGRGFGFVTFEDPKHAQNFLEVRWLTGSWGFLGWYFAAVQ